jgi:hypothetical protein
MDIVFILGAALLWGLVALLVTGIARLDQVHGSRS